MTFTKFFRAAAMTLALTCGAALAVPATTTITQPGVDMDLASGTPCPSMGGVSTCYSGWRNTAVPKFQGGLEGNNILGNDGYYATHNGAVISVPSYISSPFVLPANTSANGGTASIYGGNNNYVLIDNPTLAAGLANAYYSGNVHIMNNGGVAATGGLLQFTLTGTVPFKIRVAVMIDNQDGSPGAFNGTSIGLTCVSGTGCTITAVTVTTTSTGANSYNDNIPDYVYFDITNGVAGQTYQVIGTTQATGNAAFGLVAFDSQTLALTCPTATTDLVGESYSSSFTATGGVTPLTYSIFSGSLPPGTTLNTSTGAITGTPTTEGSYTFVGEVTDHASNTAKTGTCSIMIGQASTTTTAQSASVGFSLSSQSVTLTADVNPDSPSTATVNEGTVTFVSAFFSMITEPVSGGSSTATFTLPAATSVNVYPYTATFNGDSNYVGSDNTSSITVTCDAAAGPTITESPQPVFVNQGGTATFMAAATGDLTMAGTTVTWQVSPNGQAPWTTLTPGPIVIVNTVFGTGSLTTSLTLTNVTPAMNGLHYQVVIMNSCTTAASDPTITLDVVPAGAFEARHFVNLTVGDSYINLTNDGSTGGNICVNVYAFDPAEELVACCACNLTPHALQSLSVKTDLISNALTPATPTSVTVKLLANTNPAGAAPAGTISACNASTLTTTTTFATGLEAWGSTIHPTPQGTYDTTETPFSTTELSASELQQIAGVCGYIQADASGYGICKSCQPGGLGATKE